MFVACVACFVIIVQYLRKRKNLKNQPTSQCFATVIEKHINIEGAGKFLRSQLIAVIEKQDGFRISLQTPNEIYNILMVGDIGVVFYKEYKNESYLVDFQRIADKPA